MNEKPGFLEKIREQKEFFKLKFSMVYQSFLGALMHQADIVSTRDRLNREGVKYSEQATRSEDEAAREEVEVFAQELFSYMDENFADVLRPLNATSDQIQGILTLLFAFNGGDGMRMTSEFIRSLFSTDQPAIQYHINVQSEQDFILSQEPLGLRRTGVQVNVRFDWDVANKRPRSVLLNFMKGGRVIGEITLLTLPGQENTTANIKEHLQDRHVHSVGIFADGKQYNIESSFDTGGMHYDTTVIYRLVGRFDGLDSGKSYTVFGSNSGEDERQTVTQITQPELTPVYAKVQK